MKPESRLLRSRRLRLVVLCVLVSLGPLALMPKPARSQPAGDMLAQIQQIRQALVQMLAIYQSAKPEDRAALDRALATSYVPALQRWYNSLSPSDRAAVDAQIRQKTGYTFQQLIQMSSTVPGLVRALNLVVDAISGLAGSAKASQTQSPATVTKPEQTTKPTTPAPETPKAPAKPPTTSPPSDKTGSKPPSNGGAVDLSGTKELKLGWVLFGRTDLTDEEAQAIYDERVKKRVTALDADMAAATQRLEKAKQRLKLFEEAGEKTGLQRIVNALKDDLKEAKNERAEAMKNLGSLFAGETAKKAAGKAIKGSEDVLDVLAAGPGAYEVAALAQKANPVSVHWRGHEDVRSRRAPSRHTERGATALRISR